MNENLARIAETQEGLLGEAQIAGEGISAWVRRTYLDSGWLRKVAPRVYAVAGVPDTKRYQLRLGLLSLGDESWVSYEAAASIHGLDRSDPEAIEFTIERTGRRPVIAHQVHTTSVVPTLDRVVVNGFRTLSATRTVIDLAHTRCGVRRVEAAIDSAVRLGLSSPVVISERLKTLRGSGRWGCRLIDYLLVDSGGQSTLERRFLELVREAGLPRPRTQVIDRNDGRHIARVEFLFEQAGVVVEVSGCLGYTTPKERARDAQRRNELQDIGRRVFEYTWEDVTQRPSMVKRTLIKRLNSTPSRE